MVRIGYTVGGSNMVTRSVAVTRSFFSKLCLWLVTVVDAIEAQKRRSRG